ncbi:mannitol dehydrogenase family protein [Microbacterium sp. A94]
MTLARLSRAAVMNGLPAGMETPVAPTQIGIVHLGIGAFHRAHQAVYTQQAMRAGDLRWGILGVTHRSPTVRDQLVAQDGLYSVVTAGASGISSQLVGSVVDVAWTGEETERILAVMAAPTTHIITLTVTEKGYSRRADGSLDLDAVAADLDALAHDQHRAAPASTTIGLLVRGLVARWRAGRTPLTVLSCDNLAGNGAIVRRLVSEAIETEFPGAEGTDLRRWICDSITFPGSMVDRIVPATTPEWGSVAEDLLGLRDDGAVIGEPFMQWVIEDDFAGPRPDWESNGAIITSDVDAYERAKLRLLNGAHSVIAYAGARRGHDTVAAAMGDREVVAAARAVQEDARASLSAPAGMDLLAYSDEIIDRFANPVIIDTTRRIAADATQKLPVRWGTVRAELRAAGRSAPGIARAYQEWAAFVIAEVNASRPLVDPRSDELRLIVENASSAEAAREMLVALMR